MIIENGLSGLRANTFEEHFKTFQWIHGNLCVHLSNALWLSAPPTALTNQSKEPPSLLVWTGSGDANAAMDACRLQLS